MLEGGGGTLERSRGWCCSVRAGRWWRGRGGDGEGWMGAPQHNRIPRQGKQQVAGGSNTKQLQHENSTRRSADDG